MVVNGLLSIKAAMSTTRDDERDAPGAGPQPHPSARHHRTSSGFGGLVARRPGRRAGGRARGLAREVPGLGWVGCGGMGGRKARSGPWAETEDRSAWAERAAASAATTARPLPADARTGSEDESAPARAAQRRPASQGPGPGEEAVGALTGSGPP